MSRQYRDAAVVLHTYKLGEADRIVVLLCREHGKVRAVAKGVRKTRSKFGSRLEPTSHIVVQMYEGRGELQTVTGAELVETFLEVRTDLERLGRAVAMLEAVEQVAREGEPAGELYEMLVGGLRAVERRDTPLVTAAFFLKLLALEGFGLQIDGCAECGVDTDLVSFDVDGSGFRCSAHRAGVAVSSEAILLIRAILSGQMVWALDQPVTAATWEVDQVASTALEHQIERRLRAVRLIDHH